MENQGQVIVRAEQVPWNAEAAAMLEGADGPEPTYSMADLAGEVQSGKSQLFCWYVGQEKLGYTVLWIDAFGGQRELVFQTGAAFRSSKRAFALVMPAIETMARNQKCYAVRSHLTDGKNAGLFRSGGFYKSEVIMRKRL